MEKLEGVGCKVYEPFSTNTQNGLGPQSGDPDWAFDIAVADSEAVRTHCDGVFAVINGVPPDEGVCVELGIAIALKKPYFLFRDDFRKAADSQSFDVNLMLYAGLPRRHWEEHVYRSLKQIEDPTKALLKWIEAFQGGETAVEAAGGVTPPPGDVRDTPRVAEERHGPFFRVSSSRSFQDTYSNVSPGSRK